MQFYVALKTQLISGHDLVCIAVYGIIRCWKPQLRFERDVKLALIRQKVDIVFMYCHVMSRLGVMKDFSLALDISSIDQMS